MPLPFDAELISGALGFIFTLLVFSYLLGDNPLFRIATHIFVGVSSGYIAAAALWQVVIPRLIYPLLSAAATGDIVNPAVIVPLGLTGLGALMLLFPRRSGLGRLPLAFIVGVGAAVTLTGALGGTLIPQTQAAILAFDMEAAAARGVGFVEATANGAIILLGATLTLAYFHFGARQKPDGSIKRLGLIEALAWGGKIFIGAALGAVFAGVYIAALTALVERFASLIRFIFVLLGMSS
ncbi:MAG: hypothetical protein LDL50_06780 [Chloroflexi bacterium]|nr:hypothetical protein [Chloroflexota bacterium]MCA2001283.1 hypothetical protein [Chloroflexota bacterium]